LKKELKDDMEISDDFDKTKKEATQKHIEINGIKIDDYVKVSSKANNGKIEMMWYQVMKVNKKTIQGKLSNMPIYKQKIKPGDVISIKIADIHLIGRYVA